MPALRGSCSWLGGWAGGRCLGFSCPLRALVPSLPTSVLGEREQGERDAEERGKIDGLAEVHKVDWHGEHGQILGEVPFEACLGGSPRGIGGDGDVARQNACTGQE